MVVRVGGVGSVGEVVAVGRGRPDEGGDRGPDGRVALVAEVLGKEFITVYTEIKEVEYAEFMKVISPWEREHLLLHV